VIEEQQQPTKPLVSSARKSVVLKDKDIAKKGYLFKKGNNLIKDWRRRWFVLYKLSLYYYENEQVKIAREKFRERNFIEFSVEKNVGYASFGSDRTGYLLYTDKYQTKRSKVLLQHSHSRFGNFFGIFTC
jgi:hypothetical protein